MWRCNEYCIMFTSNEALPFKIKWLWNSKCFTPFINSWCATPVHARCNYCIPQTRDSAAPLRTEGWPQPYWQWRLGVPAESSQPGSSVEPGGEICQILNKTQISISTIDNWKAQRYQTSYISRSQLKHL